MHHQNDIHWLEYTDTACDRAVSSRTLIMDPLAEHLLKLSGEPDVSTPNLESPSPPQDCKKVLIKKYWVPVEALEGDPAGHSCVDSQTGQQLSLRVYDGKLFRS